MRFTEPADDLARANVDAVAAAYTPVAVYNSKVVDDLDRVGRALALALHAPDAAVVAHLHDLAALVLVRAAGLDTLAFGQELDDALRAGVSARAAADTLGAIDLSDAVDDVHGVELARSRAVAKPDAGKGTGLVALSAEQHRGTAVLRAGIVEALFGMAFTA